MTLRTYLLPVVVIFMMFGQPSFKNTLGLLPVVTAEAR